MARARRHQRLFSALAFGLLAVAAELVGRSLTHRIDFGRHVAAPSYAHTDYYPVLLAVVKGGIALLLGRQVTGSAHDSHTRDVPRNTPNPGEPKRALIGDPRNDENVIVSQLQATMLRFHNRLADLMTAVDIYVAPCSLETFGLSALEALASGTPILTADRGGVAETVSRSEAGLSFPSGDSGALAETAVQLLQSDLAQLGTRGRQYVEARHGWRAGTLSSWAGGLWRAGTRSRPVLAGVAGRGTGRGRRPAA